MRGLGLKLMRSGFTWDKSSWRLELCVGHPNCVHVKKQGLTCGNTYYVIMNYVYRKKPLPPPQNVTVLQTRGATGTGTHKHIIARIGERNIL